MDEHDISRPWAGFVKAYEAGDHRTALEEIQEFIRTWDDAFWANDFSAFPAVYADDVVLADHSRFAALRGAQDTRGVEGFKKLREEVADAFKFFRFDIEQLRFAAEARVLALGHIRARGRFTGLVMRGRWAALWTIRDQKIARADGFSSYRAALKAAGLPAGGSPEEELATVHEEPTTTTDLRHR